MKNNIIYKIGAAIMGSLKGLKNMKQNILRDIAIKPTNKKGKGFF